jgi:urea transporter
VASGAAACGASSATGAAGASCVAGFENELGMSPVMTPVPTALKTITDAAAMATMGLVLTAWFMVRSLSDRFRTDEGILGAAAPESTRIYQALPPLTIGYRLGHSATDAV